MKKKRIGWAFETKTVRMFAIVRNDTTDTRIHTQTCIQFMALQFATLYSRVCYTLSVKISNGKATTTTTACVRIVEAEVEYTMYNNKFTHALTHVQHLQ